MRARDARGAGVVELVLFGAAAGALAVAGEPALGTLLAVAAGVTSLLNASAPEAKS